MMSAGIGTKVTALVTASIVVIASIAFFLVIYFEKRQSLQQMKQQSAVLGESIERAVGRALQDSEYNQNRLQEIVEEIGKIEGIEEVQVFDKGMTMMAHTDRSSVGEKTPAGTAEIQAALKSGDAIETSDSKRTRRFIPAYLKKGETSETAAVVQIVIRKGVIPSRNLIDRIGQTAKRSVEKVLTDSFRSQQALQALVQDLGQLQGLDHIEVFDSSHTIIAHSVSENIGKKSPDDDPFIARVFETGKVVEQDEWEEQKYGRFIPIRMGRDPVASVAAVAEVVFSTENVIASVRDFRSRMLVPAVVLTTLLVVFLILILRRIITQRIFRLGRLAQEIGLGNLQSRVTVDSSDEIGRLGHLLNQMADKLATARSNLEKELEVQKEVDRLKDNFLAMVGHELRTPLMAVVGLSDAMLEGYTGELGPQQRHFLQQIQEKGEHLSLLINNILDLEKIQYGEMKLHLEKTPLETIVRHAVSMLETQAKEKDVELVDHFSLKLEPIMVDRLKIQSVITNLLDNAIKFTPAGGKIEITGERAQGETDSGYVELLVSDTGIGIPPAERDKIFHRFYQVQPATHRDAPGVGLGLALARSFALSHGGWLTLKERPGWSTTFSFGLPLQTESRPRQVYIRKTRFHLPLMLSGIIRMLEEEHGKTLGIEVRWSPTGDVEEIEADRDYLRSILINIFQNTLRYRTQGTPIHVFVTRFNEALYLVVETEGLPFPRDVLQQIIEEEGRKTVEARSPRSLFSLRMTAEILRAHGGGFKIENVAGMLDRMERSGVRFTIHLPHRLDQIPTQGGGENEQKENPDY